MAKSVSVLMEKSRMMNAASVPTSDTGTASSGMTVARQFCKKMKMTNTTSASASANVWSTSLIDDWM